MSATQDKETTFKPHPKQVEFIKAVIAKRQRFVLFGGAVRGGKTYALLGTFILLCKMYPGSRWAIIRKDLPRLKRNVLPQFNQIIPKAFILSKPTPYNDWTFTATNGSQIIFFAENYDQDKDLDRFKGLEVDGIGFEEMDIQEETFNKAFERVGTWRMRDRKKAKEEGKPYPPQIVAGTCNPTQNWVKTRIYDKWKAGTLPDGWLYIPSKVYDNPYIDKAWIEARRNDMTPLNYTRFVDGDWEVNLNEEPFFYEFNGEKHTTTERLNIDPTEVLWLSFDFNINPTTCIVGQKILGKGLYIYKVHQVNGGTRELCKELQQYTGHILNVTGDCSGNAGKSSAGTLPGGEYITDFNIIKEELMLSPYQFKQTQGANKLHVYSRGLCNAVFYRLPLVMAAEPCQELKRDLETGQPTNRGTLLKDRDNHKQDAGDAFRYLINAWFPNGPDDIAKFEATL